MKWIVLEDQDTTTTFIAVVAKNDNRKLSCEKKPCCYFHTCEDALQYARKLRHKLRVKDIRVLTPEL